MVSHSNWAAQIVAVPKKNGKFRICRDYKVTVNVTMDINQYPPFPKTADLNCTYIISRRTDALEELDLSQAYQQLLQDEQSKDYTTIHTHKGLYRSTACTASAPAIYQKNHGQHSEWHSTCDLSHQ